MTALIITLAVIAVLLPAVIALVIASCIEKARCKAEDKIYEAICIANGGS